MDLRINIGEGIAIAGIWIAVAAIWICSLPFVVLIIPIIVPLAAVWGGVIVTKLILGRIKAPPE